MPYLVFVGDGIADSAGSNLLEFGTIEQGTPHTRSALIWNMAGAMSLQVTHSRAVSISVPGAAVVQKSFSDSGWLEWLFAAVANWWSGSQTDVVTIPAGELQELRFEVLGTDVGSLQVPSLTFVGAGASYQVPIRATIVPTQPKLEIMTDTNPGAPPLSASPVDLGTFPSFKNVMPNSRAAIITLKNATAVPVRFATVSMRLLQTQPEASMKISPFATAAGTGSGSGSGSGYPQTVVRLQSDSIPVLAPYATAKIQVLIENIWPGIQIGELSVSAATATSSSGTTPNLPYTIQKWAVTWRGTP